MDLRYVHNGQAVAEGERAVLYQGGKLYVRTGLLGSDVADPDLKTVTYRLREVHDAAAAQPVNHPPHSGDVTSTVQLG